MLLPILVIMAQTPVPADDLAIAARSAFTAKCSQCHGPDLKHPKASFGFVTDLTRLAASPEYIVPGEPERSDLWKKIADGDMPPDGARAGPLSDQEKESILAWIRAGAPEAPTPPSPRAAPVSPAPTALELVGRFHVVLVHFPIGLLLAAAASELRAALQGRRADPTTKFCIFLGSLSAVIAAVLGWIHARDGFTGPLDAPLTIAGLHRWLGTAAAVLSLITLSLFDHASRAPAVRATPRAAVLCLAILVGIAAHFGGLLTHGADFLSPSSPGTSGRSP